MYDSIIGQLYVQYVYFIQLFALVEHLYLLQQVCHNKSNSCLNVHKSITMNKSIRHAQKYNNEQTVEQKHAYSLVKVKLSIFTQWGTIVKHHRLLLTVSGDKKLTPSCLWLKDNYVVFVHLRAPINSGA